MQKPDSEKVIWTIGHSTHPFPEFISMLKSYRIQLLVDIRSYPGSRRYPQYNKENLEITLPENRIGYLHMKSLGGRRKPDPHSHNTAWRNDAFKGFSDYMETDDFRKAIKELEGYAFTKRTSIMCSEAVWWRCHRSLVSDYLKLQGWRVMHIMGIDKATEHPYTSPARIIQGKLFYT